MPKKTLTERVGTLEHDFYGNGREGICKMVETHDDFLQKAKGALALVGFVGISNIAVLILFIIKMVK